MKKVFSRGSVILNVITVLLLVLAAVVIFYPKYEDAKFHKRFAAAVDAGESLYNAAQTFFIRNGSWPVSASDLRGALTEAKLISDWEIGNKIYSCKIEYGRGDRPNNDIQCSPMGKYASAIFYQIMLSGQSFGQRFCWAVKTNAKANAMCKEKGGVFMREIAGRATPFVIYKLPQP
ncbi:MAG: hypothetical protein MJ053_05205 [Elusimicrobiaceae bacterium]|nr:hypothetical protein [Elusimicrobiaceae bacterium]